MAHYKAMEQAEYIAPPMKNRVTVFTLAADFNGGELGRNVITHDF